MTKIGSQSLGKNFSLILFTGLLLGACAKSSHSAVIQKSIESSTQSVIGGDKVAGTSSVASKVLYLAYGVKIGKTPQSTTVGWGGHCTAAAISPRVILTAAHCVDKKDSKEI
ncbi:MAG: trypsin-like serine protease, partial [Pseudobdellovibrionaceae bacterium]